MKGSVWGQAEALYTVVNSTGRKKHADKAAFKEKIQKAPPDRIITALSETVMGKDIYSLPNRSSSGKFLTKKKNRGSGVVSCVS
jgi:hypothetical protein